MITVVICTYNRSGRLAATLTTLGQMAVPPGLEWELLVVDNNSTDDTAAVVKTFAATLPIQYVFEARQGLSQARNTGIANAKGEIIAFTDDDVTVDPAWLGVVARAFETTGCCALAGRIVARWAGDRPRWYFEERLGGAIVHFDLGDKTIETKTAPYGANMAFRREAFAKVGLFRTDLGRTGNALMSGEETELAGRILRAGEKVVYEPKAVVFHPVDEERTHKAYFRKWFFEYGRGHIRLEGLPEGCAWLFGMPRYLVPVMARAAARWAFSFQPQKRFRHAVELCRIAGMVAESRALARSGRA